MYLSYINYWHNYFFRKKIIFILGNSICHVLIKQMNPMNMNKEILYRYFNGTATQEEEEQIKQYVEASENNWKVYLKERKLFDATLLNSPSKIIPRKKQNRFTIKNIIFEIGKTAAILLLAFGLSFWVLNHINNHEDENPVIIKTQYGQMANVTLPDGSKVWLNSNTKLTYTNNFNKDKREIHMDGEAYFEVEHNVGKPFIVYAPNHKQVKVLGTKFNVEAYSNTNEFEASLMEGSVQVCAEGISLLIAPRQKAVWRDGRLKIEEITDFDTYRWREGLICFKNTPLTHILKEFEKYYNVKIDVQDAQTSNPILTVKFRLSDGIDYALRVLQKYAAFSFERNDEENRFIIK